MFHIFCLSSSSRRLSAEDTLKFKGGKEVCKVKHRHYYSIFSLQEVEPSTFSLPLPLPPRLPLPPCLPLPLR